MKTKVTIACFALVALASHLLIGAANAQLFTTLMVGSYCRAVVVLESSKNLREWLSLRTNTATGFMLKSRTPTPRTSPAAPPVLRLVTPCALVGCLEIPNKTKK